MGLGDSIKSLVHRSHKDFDPAAARTAPPLPEAPPAHAQRVTHQAPPQAFPAEASHLPPAPKGSPAEDRIKPGVREKAELLVQQQNAARHRMPHYDGLPSQFELLEKMGDGAFSHVYRALDRTTNKMVAIKCVRKYELNSTQDKRLHAGVKKMPRANERANILKEVQIMRRLRHDSIVELVAFSESNDYYFLVLELLDGGELFHQIVKLTYFSEDLARHVILQVAHGVRYLHEERGVVHRDIKPENLLFSRIPFVPSKHSKARPYDEDKEDEGEFIHSVGGGGIGLVKIADFGLSKVVWNEETVTPCGTVGYTAPEIVKDERYSKSVDMWALGCVLYTLLCGFPPFYDESIHVLTEKVARGAYTFLSPWWDDISSSSKDLISNLLSVNPEKRFTIDEFLAHPWCRMKPAKPDLDTPTVNAIAPQLEALRPPSSVTPLDSPLLQAQQKRAPMKSPGLHSLREAFDVSYAVHRMEEESARRKGYNGLEGAGRGALGIMDEEEEDVDESELAEGIRKKGQPFNSSDLLASAQNHQRQRASVAQGSQPQHRQPGGAVVGKSPQPAKSSRLRKEIGRHYEPAAAEPFHLNLDSATLLERRQRRGIARQQQESRKVSPLVPNDQAQNYRSPVRRD